jgi:hypothetical protein
MAAFFARPAYLLAMSEPERPDPKTEKTPETGKEPEAPRLPPEIGGPPGPEPTRYGDWEYKGRCTDF